MAKQRKKVKAARPVPALQVPPEQWPARTVEVWPIEKLKPHPHNARTHPQDQIEELTASFAEHGGVKPFVVNADGFILAGHGSTAALKRLGVQEVPVVVVRGWTPEQERLFMLRDNKIAANAGWDKQLLGLELVDLVQLPGVDLRLIGFKPAELDRLIPKSCTPGLTDPDEIPAESAEVVSRLGDLWLLGEHRLLCGDSTTPADVATVLADAKPHLMVTDPPYGVEYDPDWRNHVDQLGRSEPGTNTRATGRVENDARADWREAWALFPGDVAYVWHGALHASVVEASLAAVGFEVRAQIVWAKEQLVVSRGHYHWQHEPCWYAVRNGGPGHWAGDRSQSTLWEIAHRKSETGHGTQKPVECMLRPMQNNSREGDYVYEPFCGSGTALIAAEQTKRRCLAIEINPAYVDVAVKRWEGFTGKRAILAAGELTMLAAAEMRRVKLGMIGLFS